MTKIQTIKTIIAAGLIAIALVAGVLIALAQPVCQVGLPKGNDTNQIQQAIDDCAGGGEARLTSGEIYTAGSLTLKNGVTLNLNNATLQTTNDVNDYSSFKCDGCHIGFIGSKSGTNNVKIIGPGTIKKAENSNFEVALVEFINSSFVEVRDVTINSADAPKTANGFHLTVGSSDNVDMKNVTIRGGRAAGQAWGNDAVHIQSSQNVTLDNFDINTHDDGLLVGSPTEPAKNITIKNSKTSSDSAAMKLGTGSAAQMDNIVYDNITVYDSDYAIRINIYDGADVGNVTFKNITFESGVKRMFVCGGGDAKFKGVKDCAASVDRNGDGIAETPLGYIHDVNFENFDVYGGALTDSGSYFDASINTMDRVTFRNIRYYDSAGSPPLTRFRDICGLSISNITYPHPTEVPSSDYDEPSDDAVFEFQSGITNLVTDGSDPVCGTAPSCSCDAWQNQTCGGGSCPADKMQQTRTCDPAGCGLEEQCVDDITCREEPPAECSDGLDNDGDGETDYPQDNGCTSPDDDDETDPGQEQCSDGIDNDNDGWIDYGGGDRGCDSPTDNSENSEGIFQCNDGDDNDGDGDIDKTDFDCDSSNDNSEESSLAAVNLLAQSAGGHLIRGSPTYPGEDWTNANDEDIDDSGDSPVWNGTVTAEKNPTGGTVYGIFAFGGETTNTIFKIRILTDTKVEGRYDWRWLKDFRFQVSTSGTGDSDFRTIIGSTVPKEEGFHVFTFTPVRAKYVRLIMDSNYGDENWIHLGELEVYGEGEIISPCGGFLNQIKCFEIQNGKTFEEILVFLRAIARLDQIALDFDQIRKEVVSITPSLEIPTPEVSDIDKIFEGGAVFTDSTPFDDWRELFITDPLSYLDETFNRIDDLLNEINYLLDLLFAEP